MDISSSQVFKILDQKGVNELHHANSVGTACHFIRSRSLMSRGTVERRGLFQTPQSSDDIDRRKGIWFDVFMDSVDIHDRAKKANVYGPVLFVLNKDIIKNTYTGRLWVTKLNPLKWAGKSDEEKWFQDKEDLNENFVKGRFDQIIVARHCGGELPFRRYLSKIILDDPDMEMNNGVDFYSMAVGALHLAMKDAGIDVPIERRNCNNECSCKDYWGENEERLFQMFDPKIYR